MTCKKCGSEKGYYSKVECTQYYNADGQPDGFCLGQGKESTTVYCRNCGAKTNLEIIRKGKKKNGIL